MLGSLKTTLPLCVCVSGFCLGLAAAAPVPVHHAATNAPVKEHAAKEAAVSGTVLDARGNPVAGAAVHAQHPEHPHPHTTAASRPSHLHHGVGEGAGGLHKHAPIVTDSAGHFTLPHVPLDAQAIVADKQGVGKGETPVKLTAAGISNLTITLQPRK